MDEQARAAALIEAQEAAQRLFDTVEERGVIRAGTTDVAASRAIHELAAALFGVSRHWHKRIVRSGPNTLLPYKDDPPDRVIGEDDIVFTDFGPVFGDWESDLGRTYVLGDDPVKHRLRGDVATAFARGKAHFAARPDLTGAELFATMNDLAREMGWECGSPHCGHILGEFPHERIADDQVTYYITRGSDLPMRRLDADGRRLHWILEVHFVDRAGGFGGFFEELLSI
jgi:Xaa-Pro aminopeptidase